MIYPKDFEELLESFKLLPGIGEKSAERFIFSLVDIDDKEIEKFSQNLVNFKKNIKPCKTCGHLTDKEECNICSDNKRDKSVICVVQDVKSVFTFEKAGNYKGMYHVLGGLISPIDDINPEDINIANLINKRLNDVVKEVIIALNPSIEGETTSLYIQKLLETKNIKVSRLSYGIPMGSDIEYLDPLMIIKALEDRKYIS
ncbi:MAG: recombination protein RecR [Bacilli bacterium]|nr:recombination protein RecR [Bacilli bacterium]